LDFWDDCWACGEALALVVVVFMMVSFDFFDKCYAFLLLSFSINVLFAVTAGQNPFDET
jgi:hypothetical protein